MGMRFHQGLFPSLFKFLFVSFRKLNSQQLGSYVSLIISFLDNKNG